MKKKNVSTLFLIGISLFSIQTLNAMVPEHSVDENGVHIEGVGAGNPIIYDNDWWTDVFDAQYLWILTHLGEADLRANIVSRDMWDNPDYHYSMKNSIDDAEKAIKIARESGLENIPDLTYGSDRVLDRPKSGKIEDTKAWPSPGSRLIVDEAKKASPEKPLVVIVGGPLTTVANALLTNPEIGENMVIFVLSSSHYGYNGKDGWSVYIAGKRTNLVEWAPKSFWDKNSVLKPEDFADLPDTPINQELKRLINSDLGQANQLGDGSALMWLYNNGSWDGIEEYAIDFEGRAAILKETPPHDVLVIPKNKTDLKTMKQEFFRVIKHSRLNESRQ